MRHPHRFAWPAFAAVVSIAVAIATIAAEPASRCTVKSTSSARGGAHPRATASSEVSGECFQPSGSERSYLPPPVNRELRYGHEPRSGSCNDDNRESSL